MSQSVPVALKLYTQKELETEFIQIAQILKDATTAGWQERLAALRKIQGLLEGGVQWFDNFQILLKLLRDPLAAQILDLRSSVVREACLTVGLLGRKLGDQFESYIDHFIPSLFKLLGVSIAIIKESGNECIRSLISSAPRLSKPIIKIFEGSSGTSSALRLRCMEFVLLLLEVGNKNVATKFEGQLQQVLKARLADKNEEVRQKARQACCAYLESYPDSARQWCELDLDAKTRKLIQQEQVSYDAMRNEPVEIPAQQSSQQEESKQPDDAEYDQPDTSSTIVRPGLRRARSSLGGTALLRAKSLKRAPSLSATATISSPLSAPPATASASAGFTPPSNDKPLIGLSRRISVEYKEQIKRATPTMQQFDKDMDQSPDSTDQPYANLSSSTRSASSSSVAPPSVRGRSRQQAASVGGGPPSSLTQSARAASASGRRSVSPAPASLYATQQAPIPAAAPATPVSSHHSRTPMSSGSTMSSHIRSTSASRNRPSTTSREKSHPILHSHQVVGSHLPLSPTARASKEKGHHSSLLDEPLSHSQRTMLILSLIEQAKDGVWNKRVQAYEAIGALFDPAQTPGSSSSSSISHTRIPELYLLWEKIVFCIKDGLMDIHHKVCSSVLTTVGKMLVPYNEEGSTTNGPGQFTLDELKPVLERIIVDIFACLSHTRLPIREQANALLNQITQTFPVEVILGILIHKSFDSIHATGMGVNHSKVKLGILEYLHYLLPMSGNYFRSMSNPNGAIGGGVHLEDHSNLAINVPLRNLLLRISPFLSSNTSNAKATGDPKLKKLTLAIMHSLYIGYAPTFFPTLSCLPVPLNRLVRRTLVETLPDIEKRIAETTNEQQLAGYSSSTVAAASPTRTLDFAQTQRREERENMYAAPLQQQQPREISPTNAQQQQENTRPQLSSRPSLGNFAVRTPLAFASAVTPTTIGASSTTQANAFTFAQAQPPMPSPIGSTQSAYSPNTYYADGQVDQVGGRAYSHPASDALTAASEPSLPSSAFARPTLEAPVSSAAPIDDFSTLVREVQTLLRSLTIPTAEESSLKMILQTLISTVDTRLNREYLVSPVDSYSATSPTLLSVFVTGLGRCTHEQVLIRKLVIGCFVSLYAHVGDMLYEQLSGLPPVLAKLVRIYCTKYTEGQAARQR